MAFSTSNERYLYEKKWRMAGYCHFQFDRSIQKRPYWQARESFLRNISAEISILSKTVKIRASSSSSELLFAASANLYKESLSSEAKVVRRLSKSVGDTKSLEVRAIASYSSDEAMAFTLDAEMTKDQCQLTRNGALTALKRN